MILRLCIWLLQIELLLSEVWKLNVPAHASQCYLFRALTHECGHGQLKLQLRRCDHTEKHRKV